MIPSRVHAVSDYLFPALIAALSRRRGPAARRIMRVGPVWHYAYTVLTRYEGGLVPVLSMRTHLACDALGALSFVGAAALLRDEPARDRLLLAALGLSELALIAASEREVPVR
ncbi:hypothetical protein MMSR116_05795 [Methylobacterium mesophilicum SR1.6/6]|uniref:Uncharacterized protein n=1 Tax=Methylobacterium mesophilicum SR1.6/6 TaxID=908290 RepID=A0A6B9FI71_9HYPH|nr:hypothetical protein [Methylobacterium mesophilicum]QGY01466.1 hypothetical protein MMSR116_05795 [Methylobacterium mesophilicum SR1.6/6]